MSRRTGYAPQNISRWLAGSVPDAPTVADLADALEVEFRWLATGQGRQNRTPTEDGGDWVTLPHLDLRDFGEGRKPAPDGEVRVRREWLGRIGTGGNLWAADMPSSGAAEVGREGDTLVCVDPSLPFSDGRYYLLLLRGRPVLRKLHEGARGLELRTGNPGDEPAVLSVDEAEELAIIGKVLASISIRSL